jgi:hypothetical protein
MKYAWDTRKIGDASGMTWEQFKEKQFFAPPYVPNWEEALKAKPGARDFYEDPGSQSFEDTDREVRV